MTQISFNFPDDLGTIKELIETYEKGNADSKAADTSEPVTIITQDEQEVQEELFEDYSALPVWEPDLDALLSELGLQFATSCTPSSYKIACKKHIKKAVDPMGTSSLMYALKTLQTAYPTGKDKWEWQVIKDVWGFYKACEISDITPDCKNCADKLKEHATDEFIDMIDPNIPGLATLDAYNFRLHEGYNKIPEKILYDRRYQDVIKQL